MMNTGARNPKVAKFSISLAEQINERLESLADAAGMNKATMASQAVAIGVNFLEVVFLKSQAMQVPGMSASFVKNAAQQLASDLEPVVKSEP